MKAAASLRQLLTVWLALLLLLALSTASAYLPLGAFNTALNYGIAAAKVALIAAYFMHLRHAGRTVQVTAGAGLLFLWLLAFLSFGDFLTRDTRPAPWQAPQYERSTDKFGGD